MTRARINAAVLVLLAFAFTFSVADAHEASSGYLVLEGEGLSVRGTLDLHIEDLDAAIGLDADGDGALSWTDTTASQADILRYFRDGMQFDSNLTSCALEAGPLALRDRSDGAYVVIAFTAACPEQPSPLSLTYDLIFDVDTRHKVLVSLGGTADAAVSVLSDDQRTLELGGADMVGIQSFVAEGIAHILDGPDHLLFLAVLLLPSVLLRDAGGWRARSGLGPTMLGIASVVTAFTLAHSITLGAAASGFISLPSKLIEVVIAGSIVVGAFNNIWPVIRERVWCLAFAFGLLHGFGFAGALEELALSDASFLTGMLSFNLGVEIGQLAIVLLIVPVLFLIRRWALYQRVLMPGLSVCAALIGAVWTAERTLDLSLLAVL